MAAEDKIFWSVEEWEKLADIVFMMRLSDLVSPLVTIVKAAMPQMPRKRQIRTVNEIQPLLPLLDQRMRRLKDLQAENDSLRSKTVELTSEQIVDKYSKLVVDSLTPEQRLSGLSPEQLLDIIPLDQLVAESARRLTEQLLTTAIRPLEHAERPKPIDVQQIQRKALKKVCLIGLKGDQVKVIRDAIGPICNLKFVETNHSGQIPDGQDYYVTWINYINHSVEAIIKKKAPVGGYIPVVGGLSSIASKLQGILSE